jgi:hypothetical protein
VSARARARVCVCVCVCVYVCVCVFDAQCGWRTTCPGHPFRSQPRVARHQSLYPQATTPSSSAWHCGQRPAQRARIERGGDDFANMCCPTHQQPNNTPELFLSVRNRRGDDGVVLLGCVARLAWRWCLSCELTDCMHAHLPSRKPCPQVATGC